MSWFLEDNNKKLLVVLGQLLNLISNSQQSTAASSSTLIDTLAFVSIVTQHRRIQQAVCEANMHINFYNCLKDNDAKSTKFIKHFHSPALIAIVVDILKNVVLYSEVHTKQFAKILCDDIKLLTSKRDMIFVGNLLVPVLNSEKTFPVAFHPFDQFGKQRGSIDRSIVRSPSFMTNLS